MSILAPAQASEAAQKVVAALAETKVDLLYADCNAIAPQTVRQIGRQIIDAGAGFVDASIIGPPPQRAGTTRFYASGPQVAEFEQLGDFGLEVRSLGAEIGHASALKMCYAALTKGTTALLTEMLTAAQALGVFEPLQAELQLSQKATFERLAGGLPRMPTKARRFVGEMEEIAATFEAVGLTPKILAGSADIYRFVGSTPLADRSPEDDDPDPTLAALIAALAGHLVTTADQ
jgi:3-hydroxyisobutyrate dehydrogenase-like beta-hydroxyacid dehydrogenase